MVHIAVKGDADLLVAFADGGGFKFGDAFFEIGATIVAKVGGPCGFV
jgi:hypothetical protein